MISLSPKTKTLLLRIAAFFVVMFIGGLLFMVIEGRNDTEPASLFTIDEIKQKFVASYNVSEKDFSFLVETVRNNTFPVRGIPWTFENSLYFVVVLITTVGYGHIAPTTWQGQLFCIFFSLFGIPITALMLKSVGDYINLGITRLLVFIEKRLMKREPAHLETKCFILSLFLMVFVLISGAGFCSASENWTMIEGVYFTFVTLTTVGFGDYLINNGEYTQETAGKTAVFTQINLVFLILGLGIVSSVLFSISNLIEIGGFSCCKRKRDSGENSDDDDTTEKFDSNANAELTTLSNSSLVLNREDDKTRPQRIKSEDLL